MKNLFKNTFADTLTTLIGIAAGAPDLFQGAILTQTNQPLGALIFFKGLVIVTLGAIANSKQKSA